MYILTNMVKNLWRNRGRNLLFAGIVFAVITICTMGILIRNASGNLIKNYKQELSVKTTITPDMEKINAGGSNGGNGKRIEALAPEKLKSFGKSNLIKSAQYNARLNVVLKDIKAVGDDGSNGGMNEETLAASGIKGEFRMPTGVLLGSNNTNISKDFQEGLRKITKGKIYQKKNDVIISEQLAELNKLSVGDKIKIDKSKEKSAPEELTISGIYADNTSSDNQMQGMPVTNRNNEILVSEDTATSLKMFSKAGNLEAEYYLKNPNLLADFKKEVKSKGMPDTFKVYANEDAYKKAAAPLESLQQISTVFLVIVIVLGSVVLLLLSLMTIRARQREIGVLRTIGMKKSAISLGLIGETLAIVVVCMGIGMAVGTAAAQPIGQSMLESQIAAAKENETTGQGQGMMMTAGGGMPSSSEDTETKDISVKLDSTALLQIIALALAITLVSGGVGVYHTTRLEPMKILSEGN